MKIELLRQISFSELEERIRKVPLMKPDSNGNHIMIYENANITLKRFMAEQVNPPTFYLLKKGLEIQRELRKLLMEQYGLNSLNLNGALEIQNEKGEIWTLTPPIIESTPRTVKYAPKEGEIKYDEDVKINIPLINDGAHRVALAKELGLEFTGIFISGAKEGFPYYVHPNGWDRVREVDDVPKTKQEKKFYTREDCYALYRNFDVLGCGKPRHLGK